MLSEAKKENTTKVEEITEGSAATVGLVMDHCLKTKF